jgi:hypothetical protein
MRDGCVLQSPLNNRGKHSVYYCGEPARGTEAAGEEGAREGARECAREGAKRVQTLI